MVARSLVVGMTLSCMGIFSALRPSPGKLITKSLPLYLEQTEKPLASQAMVCGSMSFGLNINDKPLITVVKARSITSGCIVSAHTTAKHLCEKEFSVSESEYGAFRNSLLKFVVGSTDPEKDTRIKQDKEKYLEIARETEMAVTQLSADNIWSNWEAPRMEQWKSGVSDLYLDALCESVDVGDKNLDEEKKAQLKLIISSYCSNVAETHLEIFQTFTKEILDLMEAKGVCI